MWLVPGDHEARVREFVHLVGHVLRRKGRCVTDVGHGDAGSQVDERVAVDASVVTPPLARSGVDRHGGTPALTTSALRRTDSATERGQGISVTNNNNNNAGPGAVQGRRVRSSLFVSPRVGQEAGSALHLPFLAVAVGQQVQERFGGGMASGAEHPSPDQAQSPAVRAQPPGSWRFATPQP